MTPIADPTSTVPAHTATLLLGALAAAAMTGGTTEETITRATAYLKWIDDND